MPIELADFAYALLVVRHSALLEKTRFVVRFLVKENFGSSKEVKNSETNDARNL
jgi:hypothetical protein